MGTEYSDHIRRRRKQLTSPNLLEHLQRMTAELIAREGSLEYRRMIMGDWSMPETRQVYVAIAHTFHQVDTWKRRFHVKHRVKVITSRADLRGVGDFALLVFSGWQDVDRDRLLAGDFALNKASQTYFVDTHDPVVDGQGMITQWKRKVSP